MKSKKFVALTTILMLVAMFGTTAVAEPQYAEIEFDTTEEWQGFFDEDASHNVEIEDDSLKTIEQGDYHARFVIEDNEVTMEGVQGLIDVVSTGGEEENVELFFENTDTGESFRYEFDEGETNYDYDDIWFGKEQTITIVLEGRNEEDLAEVNRLTFESEINEEDLIYELNHPLDNVYFDYGEELEQNFEFEVHNFGDEPRYAFLVFYGDTQVAWDEEEGTGLEVPANDVLTVDSDELTWVVDDTYLNFFEETSWLVETFEEAEGETFVSESEEEHTFFIELHNVRDRSVEDGDILIGGDETSIDVDFDFYIDSTMENVEAELVVNGVEVASETLPEYEEVFFEHTETLDNNEDHNYEIRFREPEENKIVDVESYDFTTINRRSAEIESVTFTGEVEGNQTGFALIQIALVVVGIVFAVSLFNTKH